MKNNNTIFKQQPFIPIVNPNYKARETAEQILEIINKESIEVATPDNCVIGRTIPNTAIIIADFIYGDITAFNCDLNDYEWTNATVMLDKENNIKRYSLIEYKRKD